MDNELIKTIGYLIVYPIAVVWVSLRIAKFHFEKDIKKQYLLAKDKVANEVLISTCGMLLNMWELVNVNTEIANDPRRASDPVTLGRRQTAVNNFHGLISQSYSQLG